MYFDGGAMFGHVPKVVWNRLVDTDEYNRVLCSCNSLLVRIGGLNILTDPGMGQKWNEKELQLYGLTAKSYDDLLRPHGLTPADIDMVIPTHLHIDHAGGLTRWNASGEISLTFPKARVLVQRGEWHAANHPDPRSRPSYRPHDWQPVHDAGLLELLDGDTRIIDGIDVVVTGGHTLHHQAIRFTAGGDTVWYLGDILPSSAHLKPHWVMGYDLYPIGVMESRARLLPLLEQDNVISVLGHDPFNTIGKIRKGEKGIHEFHTLEAIQF